MIGKCYKAEIFRDDTEFHPVFKTVVRSAVAKGLLSIFQAFFWYLSFWISPRSSWFTFKKYGRGWGWMQNCCRLQEFIIYLLISLYLLLKERPLVWLISGQSALFLSVFVCFRHLCISEIKQNYQKKANSATNQ